MIERICDKCGKDIVKQNRDFYVWKSEYTLIREYVDGEERVDFCEECGKEFNNLIERFLNGTGSI